MIPQNNIVPFTLEQIHDKDILLIEKIYDVASELEYFEKVYQGPNRDGCKKTTLRDFWNWVIKEYLSHLDE